MGSLKGFHVLPDRRRRTGGAAGTIGDEGGKGMRE